MSICMAYYTRAHLHHGRFTLGMLRDSLRFEARFTRNSAIIKKEFRLSCRCHSRNGVVFS
jgi:hypothetical protein